MTDKIKQGTIDESKRFQHDFSLLKSEDKTIFEGCFILALDRDYVEVTRQLSLKAYNCYLNLPISIKGDILTLGFDNEAVQAKITSWIREEYLNKY